MSPENSSKRPVHLNLVKIHLPVAGVMSIIHRITGVLMFVAIPALIYLLDHSLISADGYREVLALLHSPPGKLLLFGLLWALMHHLLAGIRYLLIDLDLGVDRPAARLSAALVMGLAPLFALLLAWGLL